MGGINITGILWVSISLFFMIQYSTYYKDLSTLDRIIVQTIFLIGGPIFMISNLLETLLNYFLPEGWNDDDDSDQH